MHISIGGGRRCQLSIFKPNPTKHEAGWCFFFGDITFDGTPIKLNGNILIICTILKFLVLVASAAEVKLGALFIKEKTLVVVFLREMTVS